MLFGLLYGFNGKLLHRNKLEILLIFITKKKKRERERERERWMSYIAGKMFCLLTKFLKQKIYLALKGCPKNQTSFVSILCK